MRVPQTSRSWRCLRWKMFQGTWIRCKCFAQPRGYADMPPAHVCGTHGKTDLAPAPTCPPRWIHRSAIMRGQAAEPDDGSVSPLDHSAPRLQCRLTTPPRMLTIRLVWRQVVPLFRLFGFRGFRGFRGISGVTSPQYAISARISGVTSPQYAISANQVPAPFGSHQTIRRRCPESEMESAER